MTQNKSQRTSPFEAGSKDNAIQHRLVAADLLQLLPGNKLNDDLIHAALNHVRTPTGGRIACSVFSWTSKHSPIRQHVAKLLQNGVTTKIISAILDDDRQHWIGLVMDVSRPSSKSLEQENVLKVNIYNLFGSSYASLAYAPIIVN
jgi:hypothetical protein